METNRLLIREQLDRAIGGRARVLDRLRRIAGVAGGSVVVGDLGQVRSPVVGIPHFQRLTRRPVQPGSARPRQIRIERVADQRVPEAQPVGCAGDVRDHPRGERLLERIEDGFLRPVARLHECRELELAAKHRRMREHSAAIAGEPSQPGADHLTHAGRQWQRPIAGRSELVEPALRGQQAGHLADEEGIALGADVDRLHRHRRRPHPGGGLDQTPDVDLVESGERETVGRPLSGQVRHDHGERRITAELDVPVGADDEQRRIGNPGSHVAQEENRGLVGGVEVVDHEH